MKFFAYENTSKDSSVVTLLLAFYTRNFRFQFQILIKCKLISPTAIFDSQVKNENGKTIFNVYCIPNFSVKLAINQRNWKSVVVLFGTKENRATITSTILSFD